MYLDSAKKAELFEKYGKSATDTGSPESQIALFTFRIAHLTGHLQQNKKDYSTQRALKMIIGKRRRMLDYLQKIDIERYRAIIKTRYPSLSEDLAPSWSESPSKRKAPPQTSLYDRVWGGVFISIYKARASCYCEGLTHVQELPRGASYGACR